MPQICARTSARTIGLVLFALVVTTSARGQQPEKAAEVEGAPIMLADVDAKLGASLSKLQEQIHALRQKQLDAMIDQKLLEVEAAKRKVTIAALVQAEVTSRVAPVTAEEVAKFYEENKAKLQGEMSILEPQIKNFLTGQRLQTRQQEFLKSLRASAKVDVLLTRPPTIRSTVSTAGAPVRGASDAPVTLVEFSDFHCPFCRRAASVVDEVMAKYAGKVKLVYRDFPLANLHPQAPAVAEAARCAQEQGKFWEFHDKVFRANPDGTPVALDGFARELGLDVTTFQACRSAGKYKAAIQASLQEGTRLGITGTPTFFVNGRMLVGALPFAEFAKVIDEELAAAQPTAAAGSR